jgi:phenylalanyl-tRNA synthetase beta chain
LYRGKQVGTGLKSLAFHLEFLHPDRTLTAEEVDERVERIVTGLKEKYQAVRR